MRAAQKALQPETKRPSKQITVRLQSDPTRCPKDNFAGFLDLVRRPGRWVDPVHSHFLGSDFGYSARVTTTKNQLLLSVRLQPFTLTTRIPTKESGWIAEVVMVLSGAMMLTCGDQGSHRLSRGHFVIIDASKLHTYVAIQPVEMVVLTLSADYIYTHAGHRLAGFADSVFSCRTATERCFSEIFRMIVNQLNVLDARDASDLYDGLLCCLRPVLNEFRRSQNISGDSHDKVRSRAIDAMNRWIGQSGLGLSQIASACGVSTRYLSEMFREIGTTPMDRLWEIRLERASVMLTEEHMAEQPVSRIAARNGFASTAHFSRAFRNRYGMTPLQWRKKGFRELLNR